MTEPLVSVIMPAYNAEKYIDEAILSVVNQNYKNWELIICDDCSVDETKSIIKKHLSDERVRIIELKCNSGAAVARNTAIKKAKGDFIAFLDSDDLWQSEKLKIQIEFMIKNNFNFTCTYYSKIDQKGLDLKKIVKYPATANFNTLLKKSPGNSTVIYNKKKLGKFFISNIKKRNDYLMWFRVIEKAKYLYCLGEVLSSHRLVEGSLSNNKRSLVKYHWIIYRSELELGIVKSTYYCSYWIFSGIFKKYLTRNR